MTTQQTERCKLRIATPDDQPAVVRILVDLQNLWDVLDFTGPAERVAHAMITQQDLPPGLSANHARAQLIFEKGGSEAIGVMAYYLGYPTPNTLYVGDFYLRPAWQRHGLGREVAMHLVEQATARGFAELRLAINFGNWAALKFWVSLGFTQITKVVGPAGPNGKIELQKSLVERSG